MADEGKLDPGKPLGPGGEQPKIRSWPAKLGAIAGLVGSTVLALGLLAAGLDWVVSRSVEPLRTELVTVGSELGKVREKVEDLGERLAKVEVRVDHLDQQIQRLHASLAADVPQSVDEGALVSRGR